MEAKLKRFCLLGAGFETKNMGVSTLAAGTIKCILHQFPDAEIYLLDYGNNSARYTLNIENREIQIPLINIRFSKRFYLRNNIAYLILLSVLLKVIPFKRIRNKIISSNLCLRILCGSEIVASIAGGDSFSDIYGLMRFFYVSLPQLLVLFMGKPLILLPQTLGPFGGSLPKVVARYILNRARLVYSRDHEGLEEVRKFMGRGLESNKLRFCYDVGFVVEPIKPVRMDLDGFPEKREKNDCVVGLNISGLLYMGGYTQKNMFGLESNYREFVYELIEFLMKKKNGIVMLIPHVFGAGRNSESDSVVSEKIYDELKGKYCNRIFLARGYYDQSEIKYIISLCDFFIGSRMHACIAALSQSIPTVSIAYSKKFLGVMNTVGVRPYVADLRTVGKNEILCIVEKAFEEKDLIRKHLEQTMPEVKTRVLSLFREIREIIG